MEQGMRHATQQEAINATPDMGTDDEQIILCSGSRYLLNGIAGDHSGRDRSTGVG
jgi:hypothetical protein